MQDSLPSIRQRLRAWLIPNADTPEHATDAAWRGVLAMALLLIQALWNIGQDLTAGGDVRGWLWLQLTAAVILAWGLMRRSRLAASAGLAVVWALYGLRLVAPGTTPGLWVTAAASLLLVGALHGTLAWHARFAGPAPKRGAGDRAIIVVTSAAIALVVAFVAFGAILDLRGPRPWVSFDRHIRRSHVDLVRRTAPLAADDRLRAFYSDSLWDSSASFVALSERLLIVFTGDDAPGLVVPLDAVAAIELTRAAHWTEPSTLKLTLGAGERMTLSLPATDDGDLRFAELIAIGAGLTPPRPSAAQSE